MERPRAVGVLVFREPSERERDRLFASFGAAAGRERRRFVRAATGEFVAGQRAEERVDVRREAFGRQGIVGEGKGRARRIVVLGNFGDFSDIFRFRKVFRRRSNSTSSFSVLSTTSSKTLSKTNSSLIPGWETSCIGFGRSTLITSKPRKKSRSR